jgi:hypothetical protein
MGAEKLGSHMRTAARFIDREPPPAGRSIYQSQTTFTSDMLFLLVTTARSLQE